MYYHDVWNLLSNDVLKINEIVLYNMYAHAMMYGYAMLLWYSLAGENKSWTAAGEYKELSSSFPLGIVTEYE